MRIFDVSKKSFVPRIRIINLVDILFVLLLFFIATTTFRFAQPTAVKVVLPEAKTGEALGKSKLEQVLITVGADERIYVDNEPLGASELAGWLKDAKKKNPDLQLQLSADKKASYGTIVAVIDAARAADIQNVTAFTAKSLK